MGGKTFFKLALLLIFSLILISFLGIFASATTCITTSPVAICQVIPSDITETECTDQGGEINDTADCNILSEAGCCCDLGTGIRYVTKLHCDIQAPSSFFEAIGEGYSNSDCDARCIGTSETDYCSSNACESENSSCFCGSTLTSSDNPWCCAADNGVFSNQSTCQQSVSCAPQNIAKITGELQDSISDEVIQGASIKIDGLAGFETSSSSDGTFEIRNVPKGTGRLIIYSTQYKTEYVSYNTTGGDQNLGVIKLSSSTENENCNIDAINIGNWDFDKDGCLAMFDSDCGKTETDRGLCGDGVDNDCDTKTDCDDPDCSDDSYCTEGQTYTKCGDGVVQQPNYAGVNEECESDNECTGSEVCDTSICECILDSSGSTCGDRVINGTERCELGVDRNLWDCGGITAPSEVRCNQNCMCIFNTGDCGNGELESREHCDFDLNYDLYTETVSGSICGATQCINPEQPGGCLCTTTEKCGNGEKDVGEQCDIGVGNQSRCDFANCMYNDCSIAEMTPRLDNESIAGGIKLLWDTGCDKDDPSEYKINECSSTPPDNCNPVPIVVTSSKEYTYPISDSLNHCFSVTSVYDTLEEYDSNIICTNNTKPVDCTSDEGDLFCSGSKNISNCVQGTVKTEQECPSSYTCIDYPQSEGDAQCIFQSVCDECNGWFEMFSANDSRHVDYIQDNIPGRPLCSVIPTCYIDYTLTSVDKYYGCDNISTCYGYKSKEACGENSCQIDGCDWASSDKFNEFGVGVCRPTDVEEQDCGVCDTYSLNNFYGNCNRDYCFLFGEECYYDESPQDYNDLYYTNRGCVEKSEMACEYYTTEDDCIGIGVNAVNSKLDVNWGFKDNLDNSTTAVNPNSGTNEHTKSNDVLEFGACVWDGQSCFKDGNGNKKRECLIGSHDNKIVKNLNDCRNDMSPPSTSIFPANIVKKDLSIPFTVFDEKSPTGNTLYFNIVKKDDGCYPDYLNKKVVLKTEDSGIITYVMNVSEEYKLCYFAEDKNLNFEEVQSKIINVDATLPQLNYNITKLAYELEVYPFDGDHFVWVTDVTIDATLQDSQEPAYCTMYLTREGANDSYIYVDNEIVLGEGGYKIIDKQILESINLPHTALVDDDYIFHAKCRDDAGNENVEENQQFSFTLEADKTITDLLPHRTYGPRDDTDDDDNITISLSVITNNIGTCKFSHNSTNFMDMIPFSITGGRTDHTHDLIYNNNNHVDFNGPGIKKYFVRCNLTSEGQNRIYGNSGDVITFAIDYDPPNTTIKTKSGDLFDENKWYRSLQLSLFCQDRAMKYKNVIDNKNWAAGCERIDYKTVEGISLTEPNTFLSEYNSTAELAITENGVYSLWYSSFDKRWNFKSFIMKPLKIDDEEYNFSIKIIDIETQKEVDTITWDKHYFVEVIASKKTPGYENKLSYDIEIEELGFTRGDDYHIESSLVKDTNVMITTGVHKWDGDLNILYGDTNFEGLDGDSVEFFIKATDTHGITSEYIVSGGAFYIDTTPPATPILDPSLADEGSNDFEGYYPTVFNENNGTYYTNDKNLYITGYSNEKGLVRFHLNNQYTPFYIYDMANNAKDNELLGPLPISKEARGKLLTIDANVDSSYKSWQLHVCRE